MSYGLDTGPRGLRVLAGVTPVISCTMQHLIWGAHIESSAPLLRNMGVAYRPDSHLWEHPLLKKKKLHREKLLENQTTCLQSYFFWVSWVQDKCSTAEPSLRLPHSIPFLANWEVDFWILIEMKFHIKLELLTAFRR